MSVCVCVCVCVYTFALTIYFCKSSKFFYESEIYRLFGTSQIVITESYRMIIAQDFSGHYLNFIWRDTVVIKNTTKKTLEREFLI